METVTQTNNLFHSNRFKVNISNIPSIKNFRNIDNLLEGYIQSISFPDYSIDSFDSNFRDSTILNPISKKNERLSPIIINYFLSENFENYYFYQQYIESMRYGFFDGDIYKDNTIKELNIYTLDNQLREQVKISLTNCIPSGLSQLDLTFNEGQPVTFSVTLLYREFNMENFI